MYKEEASFILFSYLIYSIFNFVRILLFSKNHPALVLKIKSFSSPNDHPGAP